MEKIRKFAIKGKLISRVGSSPQFKGKLMIADLSCGRGGDIKKYLSIKNYNQHNQEATHT